MMKRLAAVNTLPPGLDAMGYKTDRIQGGAGFSYTRYASKQMVNGVWVNLREHVPSPLDAKGLGITSHYSVFVGMTDTGEDLPCPFFVPVGCDSFAPDAEVNWYADFGDDGESAEAFALSMGPDASKLEPRWVVDEGTRGLYMNNQAQSLRPKFC
jgi:hypothetical protein